MIKREIHQVLSILLTVILVIFAAALRIWPLQELGSSVAWITFYPIVMFCALYGGLYQGLLATALTCLLVDKFWFLIVDKPFMTNMADWLSMAVFIFNGSVISGVAEATIRAKAKAEKSRQEAEAANKAKSIFLANMSHELRTPLNAILGFSSIMQKNAQLPESERKNLDIINRSGEHLLMLINDVLEMAKIDAGRLQLEETAFDLINMCRDVINMMLLRAENKGVQLIVEQSSKLPRFIWGDEARLRQILINLIGNAIKFTPAGIITLHLDFKQNSVSHLLITVKDTGIGIAPNDQQHIFEPFVQINRQGAENANKGTGLGLTITRQFIQLMGGKLSLESTPGKGSSFQIDLPLKEAHEIELIHSKEINQRKIIGLLPGQPDYRILIVEDQLENQLLLTQIIEFLGLKTKIAENGLQGIEIFQNWYPDLIWMDRRMPVMDGLETTRQIRQLPGGKDVKIIAVTASAFIEQRDEMLHAGMDDFLRKPYHIDEIYQCLAKHLGIQYLYETENEAARTEQINILTAERLNRLPMLLRNELRQVLESLETEKIAQVIEQVGEYDLALQKELIKLADNFDYPSILKLFDDAK